MKAFAVKRMERNGRIMRSCRERSCVASAAQFVQPRGRIPNDLGVLDLLPDPQGLFEQGNRLVDLSHEVVGDAQVAQGDALAAAVTDLAGDDELLLAVADRLVH